MVGSWSGQQPSAPLPRTMVPHCPRLLKLAQLEVIREAAVSAGGELYGSCWSLGAEQGCPGRGCLGQRWPHCWAIECRAPGLPLARDLPHPMLGHPPLLPSIWTSRQDWFVFIRSKA